MKPAIRDSEDTMSSFGRRRTALDKGLRPTLLAVLAVGGLLVGAPPASAAIGDGNCMEDVFFNATDGHLVCTANDVRIATAGNIRDINGDPLTQCNGSGPNPVFSFIADFTVELSAQTRHDVGLYFATDGDPDPDGVGPLNADGALTGVCDVNLVLAQSSGPPGVTFGSNDFVNLDPTLTPAKSAQPNDICGDIDDAHNPQVVTVQIDNAACVDTDGDGNVNLPNCTSWRQPGANESCEGVADAFPGAPSKCNCDPGFNIPVFVETGTIEVTKEVTNPSNGTLPEPGGAFTYSIKVENTSTQTDVTLDRICDDKYGLIDKVASAPACPVGTLGSIDSTTCDVQTSPVLLEPDDGQAGGPDEYTCTFIATATSDTPTDITDTVTVFGHDENDVPVQANDSATVHIDDVPPTAEVIKSADSIVCATVRYDVQVNNLSEVEDLTLSKLEDDGFGSLTSVHDDVVATDCTVPQTLKPKDPDVVTDTYECTFDAEFCGTSHTDTVTGTLNDDENTEITEDSNTVTVTPQL